MVGIIARIILQSFSVPQFYHGHGVSIAAMYAVTSFNDRMVVSMLLCTTLSGLNQLRFRMFTASTGIPSCIYQYHSGIVSYDSHEAHGTLEFIVNSR